jgi:hypothetical protein
MDKKLLAHEQFIKNNITKFERELHATESKNEDKSILNDIQNLYVYHTNTVRDFQHERLIHLIVTLFFAGLWLLSIFTLFLFLTTNTIDNHTLLCNLSLIISLILLITELFYIRHYYMLENGTQRLYKLSQELLDMTIRIGEH